MMFCLMMIYLIQLLLQVSCFYGLGQIFRSGAVSEAVEIKIYKTMVKAVVCVCVCVCGSATWTVAVMGMKRLNTWERKLLRRIMIELC
jgi:hypothetical protein